MRKLRALALVFVATLGIFARAATPVDLGQGLGYVRIHSLGDDTAALTASTAKAIVIDLRHATASDETVVLFAAALESRATSAQIFILVSPSTPRALAKTIEALSAKVLTLGTEKARPSPKVVVETEATADRAAYDAFETGTPLEKLINGKIDKVRYDEATLVQEFKTGHIAEDPAEPVTPPAPDTKSKTSEAKKEETKPVSVELDRVLQRAIHLHRALSALR
ncbi:hypothetical protein [Oleiharenicola lentus]|uniref:hypothetical protein n=1 Tax=Oleiharenicola lentus TaxID=2508720 RepID=UPI003F67C45D